MQEWFVCVLCANTIKSSNIGQSNILGDENKDPWYIWYFLERVSHTIMYNY